MIVVASATVYLRILIEMAAVAPNTFGAAVPPLGVMLGGMVLLAAGMYLVLARDVMLATQGTLAHPDLSEGTSRPRKEEAAPLAQGNPAELLPALIFGGLYALVLLGVAAVHDYFGPRGLYGIAVISGLHDLDAITLSTARFVEQGQLETQLGWRLILAASLSNLILKGAVVAILGERNLLKWIALPYGAALVGGMALLLLWPN
jgi:uncharacterized membrane protein (DUF4010 family)